MFLDVKLIDSKGDNKKRKPIIVISKKVVKLAASRNLIKRRIRAILREAHLPQNKNFYVFVGEDVSKFKFQDLKDEIFKKIKNLNK